MKLKNEYVGIRNLVTVTKQRCLNLWCLQSSPTETRNLVTVTKQRCLNLWCLQSNPTETRDSHSHQAALFEPVVPTVKPY